MFEKIAQQAFNDELSKIADYAEIKMNDIYKPIKQKINMGSHSSTQHKRVDIKDAGSPHKVVPQKYVKKISREITPSAPRKALGSIGKFGKKFIKPLGGALALSGLAFGAGSIMAANSGSGLSE